MKRSIAISILLLPLGFLFMSSLMDDNGRAGAVGSPGETTCRTSNCHNSYPVNSGSGSVAITSTMNNWTYESNTTYTISIKVAQSNIHLFGFACEILTYSNTNAGTMIVTDAVHTTTKQATIGTTSRRSMVHKLNGGASQDSMIFTFDWTSPDTSTGDITMYFCGNAANGNGQPTFDYIYTGTKVCSPVSSTTGLSFHDSKKSFSVFPNPASDYLNVGFSLPSEEEVAIRLYDLSGKGVHTLEQQNLGAGQYEKKFSLINIIPGVYLLSVESVSGRMTRKIMIN